MAYDIRVDYHKIGVGVPDGHIIAHARNAREGVDLSVGRTVMTGDGDGASCLGEVTRNVRGRLVLRLTVPDTVHTFTGEDTCPNL
jgi:hypothetical protein